MQIGSTRFASVHPVFHVSWIKKAIGHFKVEKQDNLEGSQDGAPNPHSTERLIDEAKWRMNG